MRTCQKGHQCPRANVRMVNSDVQIALAISDGIVDIGEPLLQDRGAFLPPMRRKKSQNEVAYHDNNRVGGLGNAICMVGSSRIRDEANELGPSHIIARSRRQLPVGALHATAARGVHWLTLLQCQPPQSRRCVAAAQHVAVLFLSCCSHVCNSSIHFTAPPLPRGPPQPAQPPWPPAPPAHAAA